ncbi:MULTISPECIES: FAD-binding oxidoreductase [unclassified Gilliamella]|uniref:FAD-binding oxidoreductase n=1 Tax=unclassified Gilliamella TaxID=2685620 RepID=UPI001324F3C0|nr:MULTISPECIES: FAD-binding oxidoreductase [unclassified Gilliamella]MWN32736.1 FAD-binding protein [Gilliamella sp. Pra-s60]MWP30134.1 FAD-binding protein [Gilliamella sp. Pra-s54]
MKKFTFLSCCLFLVLPLTTQAVVVNDVTGMTPVEVTAVMQPESTQQVAELIKNSKGPISIAGKKYSMGGQTAINNGIQIDTQKLNHVIDFNPEQKLLTIETGATWRQVQELIDPYNLSVKIMQSYANFSIGGSLSVNVHGRYIGEGPIILSVEKFKIVLADGSIVEASPKENQDIFYGAIGGYGGLGVITEVTLRLADNVKVKRISDVMPITQYYPYFMQQIRSDKRAIFHNSVIYPPDFEEVRAVTFKETQEPLTILDRLRPTDQYSYDQEQKIKIVASSDEGKRLRKLYDDLDYIQQPVMWRNYEASFDVSNLQPIKDKDKSFALEEYFIPVDRFEDFYPELIAILKKHRANVINISIRHANADSGSLLAWAKTEVFAFVIYYQQATDEQSKKEVGIWTRELIDAVLAKGGSYYLPYQLHATSEQFQRAYPQAERFFKLKAQLDPENKFSNMMLKKYGPSAVQQVK